METIELELQQIASANLYHLIPSYLFDYFKDELNDRILVNLINDLDSLIQTIETNNSFKILSLNENTDNENDNRDRVLTNEEPSSLNSEVILLNSCKSLLSDISIRLNEIFTKYSSEINLIIDLFERQQYQQKRFNSKIYFSSRNDLVVYQRAILVQHLSTKHYELFNLVFRNVFDYYQNSFNSNNNNASLLDQDETLVTDGMTEQDDKMNESGLNSSANMKLNNQILLDNFDRINQIL
jgi:hypothetical protein